jgi:hypothetical protein
LQDGRSEQHFRSFVSATLSNYSSQTIVYNSFQGCGVLCSLKASIMLTCAYRLAALSEPSTVWFISQAGASLELPGLLLPPGTNPADTTFARVKLHTLDTQDQLIKLLASVHLLPTEEIPTALLLDDSRLCLLGNPSGLSGRVSEQRLAFGAPHLSSAVSLRCV